MMDKKYLAEIKARVQEAKAEKQKGNDLDCACLSWAIALNDIPALLDEVERLERLYTRMSEDISMIAKDRDTLKRALKIVFSEFGRYLPNDMDFYIQQAQEQEGKK